MAKHRYDIDEHRIHKWLAAGRGEGTGAAYKPWLSVQDLSSRGRSSRMPGKTTGRTHELMSDLERSVLLEFDNMAEVTDIREQYPLPRESTIRIADQAGIRHPAVRGVNMVMSTDFVVDSKAGRERRMAAIAVKYAADLEQSRTIEKLEIERRFWASRDVPWFVVTELDLSADQTKVALWRHGWETFDHLETPSPGYWKKRCDQMLRAIERVRDEPLLSMISALERDHDFAQGDGLTVIRHLLAVDKLKIASDGMFDVRGSVRQLAVCEAAEAADTQSHAA